MNTGWLSSSVRKQCVVCRRMTAHYKTHEESGIEIRIPLCDAHFDSTDSAQQAQISIQMVKKDILNQWLVEVEK